MTIPIHPVVFILAIFSLMIAIFAIGYAIGHNEGELKSAQTILILAQKEFTELEQEINNEIIHLPPPYNTKNEPCRHGSDGSGSNQQEEGTTKMNEALAKALNNLRDQAYFTARDHGFHEGEVNDGLILALIHSEVSEALDVLRHGNSPDKHCPQYDSLTCELADILIRVLDYAGLLAKDIGGAVIAKMEYNKNRPYKHGKKF